MRRDEKGWEAGGSFSFILFLLSFRALSTQGAGGVEISLFDVQAFIHPPRSLFWRRFSSFIWMKRRGTEPREMESEREINLCPS